MTTRAEIETRVLEHIDRLHDAQVGFLAELVKVPSDNPPGNRPAGSPLCSTRRKSPFWVMSSAQGLFYCASTKPARDTGGNTGKDARATGHTGENNK